MFATNVGFSVNLTNDSADLFLNNDFRQIGVIKNPLIFNSNNNFQDTTGTCCYVIQVLDPQNYALDDVITTDSGGKFIVIQKVDADGDGTDDSIYLLPIIPIITESSTLTNTTQSISNLVINTDVSGETVALAVPEEGVNTCVL